MQKVTCEYTCDGCGKTFVKNSDMISVFSPDRPHGLNRLNILKSYLNGGINNVVDYDFCDSCSKKVVEFFDDFTKKDE